MQPTIYKVIVKTASTDQQVTLAIAQLEQYGHLINIYFDVKRQTQNAYLVNSGELDDKYDTGYKIYYHLKLILGKSYGVFVYVGDIDEINFTEVEHD